MKLRFRGRLFLISLALIAAAIIVSDIVLVRVIEKTLVANSERELHKLVLLAKHVVETAPSFDTPEAADLLADRLGREIKDRITLIRADGKVMGDSDLSLSKMTDIENHKDRPEVREALASGFGASRRYSSTEKLWMIYAAVTYQRPDSRGVVRVSQPLSELETARAELRRWLALAGLVGFVVAMLMSALSAHFFSRTLRSLVNYARIMAESRGVPMVEAPKSYEEITGLAGSLQKLSNQLEEQVNSLSRERDLLEAVLSGMSEAVLALDGENRITLINPAAVLLLGLSKRPLGETLLDTVRAPELHKLVESVRNAGTVSTELVLNGPEERQLLVKAAKQRFGGAVVVLLDVTKLRRLEAIRRDFVANVSHELRTPVSVIHAAAETLVDGALDDPKEAERFLKSILANTERIANLISDLLDISRIEAGKYEIEIKAVDVESHLVRAAASLDLKAKEKNVTVEIAQFGGVTALADPRALEQALFNLIDNAIKYVPADGRVSLRTVRHGSRVRIEVEDDGVGIEPKHRDRLFERFYRVDPGRSREMGGTGLGLAIAKHVVNAMNGEIGMEPAAPRGSIFWISLPLA